MSLPVRDLVESRAWYVDNLGLKVEFEDYERRTVRLQDDADFTIFLYETAARVDETRPAFFFQVSDVDVKYRELSARGVAFALPPNRYFWGYGAALDDPNGYRVHIWTSMRTKGAEG